MIDPSILHALNLERSTTVGKALRDKRVWPSKKQPSINSVQVLMHLVGSLPVWLDFHIEQERIACFCVTMPDTLADGPVSTSVRDSALTPPTQHTWRVQEPEPV